MATDVKDVLAQAELDLAQAEAEAAKLRVVVDYLNAKLAGLNGIGHATNGKTALTAKSAVAAKSGEMTHSQAAEQVLRDFGKPTKHKEIVRMIVERKLVSTKSNRLHLSNSIYSAMTRDENKFRRSGRGIWSLVEWDRRKPSAQENSAKEP